MTNVSDREIKTIFLDASAIVKYYFTEYGSNDVREIFHSHSVRYTTSFCLAEALGVFKCKHRKGKTLNDTDAYLNESLDLIESIKGGTITIEEQNIFDRNIYDKVEKLVEKFKIDISDIFQLVSIKESFLTKNGISCTLITSDEHLFKAAKIEKIAATFIPNNEEQQLEHFQLVNPR